jgi:plastocyanin
MRAKSRWLMSAVGVAVLTVPVLTGSVARADSHGPKDVLVNILGGDHFPHPGLLINDYRFPNHAIVVNHGDTITFHNLTDDVHTIALFAAADVPTTVDQVHNCPVCDAVNGVFGLNGPPGPPSGAQIDNGQLRDDDSQTDGDVTDTGAINSLGGPTHVPPSILPILVEDFDTPSHSNTVGDPTVGDATVVATPGHGPTQRTIAVTASPGLYHYICTIHPWMQGTILVKNGEGGDS